MNPVHSFPKADRLCSRKAIETLFTGGNRSLTAFPLRVIYSPADSTRVLVSVSKRHFKHAVDRNRAKRQVREAWRLNREILWRTAANQVPADLTTADLPATDVAATIPPLHIAFVWLADETQSSGLVHRKLKNLLHRIREQLTE